MRYCWQCSVDVMPGATHHCAGNGKKIGLHPNSKLKGSFGVYEPLSLIGNGALAVVLKSKDQTGNIVAIKQCLDPVYHGSFEKEARALMSIPKNARVSHRIDYIEDKVLNEKYIVMEYIEGENLYQMLVKKNHKFSQEEVLSIGYQVLEVLDLMHGANYIHRDIKPENLIQQNGTGLIYVIDFGGARSVQNNQNLNMTQVMTPLYAPRELREGTVYYKPVKQSDFYCLAASMYELLLRSSLNLDHHDRGVETSVINKLPAPWRPVFKKALEMDPKNRFQTALEFQNALVLLSGGKLKRAAQQPQPAPIKFGQITPAPPVAVPKTLVTPMPPQYQGNGSNRYAQTPALPPLTPVFTPISSPAPPQWQAQVPAVQPTPQKPVRKTPNRNVVLTPPQPSPVQTPVQVPPQVFQAFVQPQVAPQPHVETDYSRAVLEIVVFFGIIVLWSYLVYEGITSGFTPEFIVKFICPSAIVTMGIFGTIYFWGSSLASALYKGFVNNFFVLPATAAWLVIFCYMVWR